MGTPSIPSHSHRQVILSRQAFGSGWHSQSPLSQQQSASAVTADRFDSQGEAKALRLMKYVLKWAGSGVLTALLAAGFISYWISSNDCDRRSPANPIKAITHCEYGGPE